MKIEVTLPEGADAPDDIVDRIVERGAFLDDDGDLNIIIDEGKIVCFSAGSGMNFTPFVRFDDLTQMIEDKSVREIPAGTAVTFTF